MNDFYSYPQNDYRNYIRHSWGTKPEQKAAEKAYNAKYYAEHKSKWKQYREDAADALGFDDKAEYDQAAAEYKELEKQFYDLRYQINNYPYSQNPTPEQIKELNKLYEQYYQALDKYNAAKKKLGEASANYKKNGSLARIIDDGPRKTAKRVADAVDMKVFDVKLDVQDKIDEATGAKAKRRAQDAGAEYHKLKKYADMTEGTKYHKRDVEEASKAKAAYEQALDDYGNTPIGRIKNTVGVLTGKKKIRHQTEG